MKNYILALLIFVSGNIFAEKGTTGKLYGQIINTADGSAVPGISVVIKGEKLGAASDADGNYFIINILPGEYTVEARGIGFEPVEYEKVKISADLSTKLNIELEPSGKYELSEKMEQFYLQDLPDEVLKKLEQIKKTNLVEYQSTLMKAHFQNSGKKNESRLVDEILKLTKAIEETAKKYKLETSEKTKKQLSKELYSLLSKRFSLIEKNMEIKIKKLADNIDELKQELVKFRSDRENIIKGQFEKFVK